MLKLGFMLSTFKHAKRILWYSLGCTLGNPPHPHETFNM
jgi:hypothetical protein